MFEEQPARCAIEHPPDRRPEPDPFAGRRPSDHRQPVAKKGRQKIGGSRSGAKMARRSAF
jgi:hypothetical protein